MLDKAKDPSRTIGDFTVEASIPIPGGDGARRNRYPFADMNFGDSFAFNKSMIEAVRRNAHAYAARHDGVRFVFRAIDEETYRCWKMVREDSE
jgi:hypothetical protein